jgi:thiosulfate/3-mercaptopyruvate sulfurtransferase
MRDAESLIVTPERLSGELSSGSGPLLIDLRPAHEFARHQLPRAVHLDLWGVSLIDTSEAPLRAFMWMVGHLFSLRGVDVDRPVVVYEHDSGVRAARAFWLLEYLGHPNVRLLDGGIKAWRRLGLALGTEPVVPTPSSWHGERSDHRIATRKDVVARLGQPDTVLLDTRSEDEYCGRVIRARRGGHIPGAVHLEWTENLTADGAYKSPDELRGLYAPLGVTPEREIVTYCQGGYRAAHSYLALRLLGFPRVRNYTGSWKEWGDRDDVPVDTPEPS